MLPFVDNVPLLFGLLTLGGMRHELPQLPRAAADSMPPVRTLAFEWGAANLALEPPYDTVQLRAIARTATGVIVPIPVGYTSPDPAITVSATGLVTARLATHLMQRPASVIARATQDGRTFTDTAIITVTPHPLPAPLATLSIQPQPGGLTSAHGNLGEISYTMPLLGKFPFFATMATGNPRTDTICNAQGCRRLHPLAVHFTSSDPRIVYITDENAGFHPLQAGRVTLTVSTIAYGVRKVDSLPFSVGYNQFAQGAIYVDNSRTPPGLAVFRSASPYSVGLHLYITNHAPEPIEIRLPAHGVHFHGLVGPAWQDTVAVPPKAMKSVVVDSAGTYVLQYRGLRTGAVLSDTIVVLSYP